jgi:hypothetical protein
VVFTNNQQKPLCFGQYLSDIEASWALELELLPELEKVRIRRIDFQRWTNKSFCGEWSKHTAIDLMPAPVPVKPTAPIRLEDRGKQVAVNDDKISTNSRAGTRPAKTTSSTTGEPLPEKQAVLAPQSLDANKIADPLGEPVAELTSSPGQIVDKNVVDRYNRLLYWLSAAGDGTWNTFNEVCRAVGLPVEPRRVVRTLQLLGHLSLYSKGMRWVVPEPFLLQSAVDDEHFILCGQRSISFLNKLPLGRELTEQIGGQGPTRIVIRIDKNSPPLTLGKIGVRYDQEKDLRRGENLPLLKDWSDRLTAVDRPNLASFAFIERWNDGRWQTAELREDYGRYVGPSGMYQLTRTEPYPWTLVVYFDAQRQRFLRSDWYGLRFWARKTANLACRAFWRSRILAIHDDERWPLLFEKAIVQATGLLSDRNGKWLRYSDVPESLASLLCQRLGVELKPLPPTEPVPNERETDPFDNVRSLSTVS